jgi:hypothetical protein
VRRLTHDRPAICRLDGVTTNYRAIGSTTMNIVPSPTVLCSETRKRDFVTLDQILDDGQSQASAGDAVLFHIAGRPARRAVLGHVVTDKWIALLCTRSFYRCSDLYAWVILKNAGRNRFDHLHFAGARIYRANLAVVDQLVQ